MFQKEIKLTHLSLIISIVNLILFHIPFYKYVFANTDTGGFSGILLIVSLTVLAILLNALVFYIILYALRRVGRWLLSLFFVINSIALYFINTYSVIIDRSMVGNVFNTNYSEASSFFSFTFVLYVLFLGIIPSFLILKVKFTTVKLKKFLQQTGLTLLFLLGLSYANSSNWLWIDKHSTELGSIVMPWSYVVNTFRYFSHQREINKEQIKLPDATFANDSTKTVVVLVIGESARRENFSLYGYPRETNPLLSKVENLHVYPANSSATYTTAGVKAILEYKETNDLYEILPNYLFRNGAEVIWRTTNWGEPTVRIDHYMGKDELMPLCKGDGCEYDEILLSGLKEQILASDKSKIFVVLHTSTSHGPTYSKKYPPRFNKFVPVCESVELDKCSQAELINAYDNTIVYTDYILATLIDELKQLHGYQASMLFVSDHGESLGEKNLYMHGVPLSFAPKEQYEIPFLVWTSDSDIKFKKLDMVSQHYVFHTVLDLLNIQSPIYDTNMTLMEK